MQGDEKTFDVIFTCHSVNEAGMRTDMDVRMVRPDTAEYQLASDEGRFHGGGGTAPTPLCYFAAALASCLTTQLRAFSKRLKIPAGKIKTSSSYHWKASQVGRAPYVSAPVAFDLSIELDSDADFADQVRLIEAAKKGCFIEQTLAQGNTISHRLKYGGDWIAV